MPGIPSGIKNFKCLSRWAVNLKEDQAAKLSELPSKWGSVSGLKRRASIQRFLAEQVERKRDEAQSYRPLGMVEAARVQRSSSSFFEGPVGDLHQSIGLWSMGS